MESPLSQESADRGWTLSYFKGVDGGWWTVDPKEIGRPQPADQEEAKAVRVVPFAFRLSTWLRTGR
jgi:hypothetical protein